MVYCDSDNLDEAAGAFKNTAGKLKSAFWWKDFKVEICSMPIANSNIIRNVGLFV